MKTVITVALSLGSLALAVQPQPEITFETSVHDFGSIHQNEAATIEFSFENTGTGTLIISNAEASCGCTIPKWPRNPIAPGEHGTILVRYDAKKPGPFQKTVTITSNATDPRSELRIKGHVQRQSDRTEGTSIAP